MKRKSRVGSFQGHIQRHACLANVIAKDIFTLVNTPLSLRLMDCLESGNFSEIVSASVTPMEYGNADTYSKDYLCAELMSKFPHWDLGIDRASVGLSKWLQCETELASLDLAFPNQRLSSGINTTGLSAVILTARRKISHWLGEFRFEEFAQSCSFGPGASTSKSRRRSDTAYKFGESYPDVTLDCLPIAVAYRNWTAWKPSGFRVVAGSRLTTVPKNAKTDRVICIEPDLNMYFQKGIGQMIRRRLIRSCGLLVPTAQQLNAEGARDGSATGRYASIDLSSASDTIHLGLCMELLPPEWYRMIELTRSPSVVLPSGELRSLLKVSSMGNGYTFELETLIFKAIAESVHDLLGASGRQPLVYGDDIITSTDVAAATMECLSMFGFTPNHKKSFLSGPFRESCGKHYFNGADVSPFYIRDRVDSNLEDYKVANRIREWSRLSWGLDPLLRPAYDRILTKTHPRHRHIVPDGYGDVGFIGNFDEATPKWCRDSQTFTFRGLTRKSRKYYLDSEGTLWKSLRQVSGCSEVTAEVCRPIDDYKIGRIIHTGQWPCDGGWLSAA